MESERSEESERERERERKKERKRKRKRKREMAKERKTGKAKEGAVRICALPTYWCKSAKGRRQSSQIMEGKARAPLVTGIHKIVDNVTEGERTARA